MCARERSCVLNIWFIILSFSPSHSPSLCCFLPLSHTLTVSSLTHKHTHTHSICVSLFVFCLPHSVLILLTHTHTRTHTRTHRRTHTHTQIAHRVKRAPHLFLSLSPHTHAHCLSLLTHTPIVSLSSHTRPLLLK